MAGLSYKPSWAKYERDANNPEDAKKALEASDKFIQEREHEMKVNPKAKKWEDDRKKEIAKQKPEWVKKRNDEEKEKLSKPLKSLKDIGSFDGNIKPSPGFLIVEVEQYQEQTDSGLFLPDATNKEPNTGSVVEISDPLTVVGKDSVNTIPCPVSIGDKILFKRYAGAMGSPGAEITIKGKDYRLMRWNPDPRESDILGVFYD